MHIRTTVAGLALAGALLSGCSSTGSSDTASSASSKSTSSETAASVEKSDVLTAQQAVAALEKSIPELRLVREYTEANDPNHLLGRPGGYTGKAAFSDSRVASADVEGLDKDAVERGGSVEVFKTAEEAKARAKYIETIAKSMPGATEYHYIAGGILVRVSNLLTPTQAKDYEAGAESL
jgi:ABC-type Fe3+-hydroxamate transport system substrate-binding protein